MLAIAILVSAILATLVPTRVPMAGAAVAAIKAQPVTTARLRDPATFTFAPDGRIFYGEKATGQIRIINRKTGSNSLFFTFPNLYSPRESGLLGLALHPRYPSVPYVYAYGTQLQGGRVVIRLLRITDRNGVGSSPVTILSASSHDPDPRYPEHKGGRLLFGSDGMLYVYVGYSGVMANSQNLRSVFGKILRMTPDGQVPSGNPFPGSPVWSYGHRASFGMAFDPWTRRLWLTEGGPECNDELNLVVKGGNYGWGPKENCKSSVPPPRDTNQDGPNPIQPKIWWRTNPTNVGLVFCARCGLGRQNEGRMFMGVWEDPAAEGSVPDKPGGWRAGRAGDIYSMTLSKSRDNIASQSLVFTNTRRRPILSMERGPDRGLYFSDRSGIYKLVLG